jgi:hypothetical protein
MWIGQVPVASAWFLGVCPRIQLGAATVNQVGCFEDVCLSCDATEHRDGRLCLEQVERNRVACPSLLDIAAMFLGVMHSTSDIFSKCYE